ncbi:MAG: hypothetical protein WEC37_00475, partial [Anaerolineales bacterium]
MAKTLKTPSEQELLKQLRSTTPSVRAGAAQNLAAIPQMGAETALAIEHAALYDKSERVRAVALSALKSNAYKQVQFARLRLAPSSKQTILEQIELWKKDDLIDEELAQVLSDRYAAYEPLSAPAPAPAASQPVSPKQPSVPVKQAVPKRSLSEILFSQTTINIALFLGAFFVLAAALFLAALNASLRIPVLFAVTVVFLVGALAFRKRLPSASLTLFIVYSLLVPILTRVLLESSSLPGSGQQISWLLVTAFLVANWAFATIQYHSRLFAVLAFVGFNSLASQLGSLLEAPPQLTLLMLGLANLGSLAAAFRFKRLNDQVLYTPLYVLSQIWQFILLILIVGGAFPFVYSSTPAGWHYLVLAAALLVSSFYYFLSQRSTKLGIYPYLAVACLVVFPWAVLNALFVDSGPVMFVTWLWGSLFAVMGNWLIDAKKSAFHAYGTPLLWSSGILYVVAALAMLVGVSGLLPAAWWSFIIFAGIAAVYTYLNIVKPRHLVWASALLAYFFAYWSFLALPFLENVSVFEGFLFLWPALAYLSFDIVATRFLPKDKIWRLWPRAYGAIVAAFTALILLSEGGHEPLRVSLGFLILALFLVIYTNAHRAMALAYLVTTGFALGVYYFLQHLDFRDLALPLFALGGAYLLGGFALLSARRLAIWARPLYTSGLALVGLIALFAPGARTSQEQGLYLLLAAIAFVLADLSERLRKQILPAYSKFTRLGAVVVSLYGALFFVLGLLDSWEGSLAFVIYSALFSFYALALKSPRTIYLSAIALTMAAGAASDHFQIQEPTYHFLALGSLYYLSGLALFRSKRTVLWARPLHFSGLILIGLVALFNYLDAPLQQQIVVLAFSTLAFVLADLAAHQRKHKENFTRLGSALFTVLSVVIVSNGDAHPMAPVIV